MSAESLIACVNCNSACCRKGMNMYLTDREAGFLEAAGTKLFAMVQPNETVAGMGLFALKSDCAHLKEEGGSTLCSVYTNSDRPQTCDKFKVGSAGCRSVRQEAGIDPHREESLMEDV